MKSEMIRSFLNLIANRIAVFFCLLLLPVLSYAQADVSERQILVPAYSGSAKALLEQISEKENITFAHSSKVSLNFEVRFQQKKISLQEFLNILLEGQSIDYKIKTDRVLLYPMKEFSVQTVSLSQTVRGTVVDMDSKLPLIGAQVILLNSNPLIGAVTDVKGEFRLDNIPVGKITVQISYIGYESKTIPNITVNSGKEVVLNINMRESVLEIDEVVVRPVMKKGEAINDMSLISARSISIEETKRYAGGFSDPSRILSSFAGVANSANGENDIIVRGNSPKYMQWRLEGVEITNPSHFGDQNSIKGGISALNNNLLAASDFSTSAFSPEYGNVLSGVYDVKLRAGNNEKFETAFGLGLLGTDLTLEGPFKKGYAGSYLINYRYSTVSLINKIDLDTTTDNQNFQDVTFKILLPTKNSGTFSFFGVGGLCSFMNQNIVPDRQPIPDYNIVLPGISKDHNKKTFQFNTGLNHTLSINENSFLRTSLSFSVQDNDDDVYETDIRGSGNRLLSYRSSLESTAYRGAIKYSNKLNSKNKIQIGAKYTMVDYDNHQHLMQDDSAAMFPLVDFREKIGTIRSFISWRYRLNNNFTVVAGIHNMNVLFNQKSTLEPRVAINWKLNETNTISAGYGKHSCMESIHNYFANVKAGNGNIIEPNKNLDLLKAHHFVMGYEKRFTRNFMAKLELYYQFLYDLPVENLDTSYYATINEDTDFRYVDLVNKGTGKNYGAEITLERFLNKNYYFLLTASVFNSNYKSLENIVRNTQYNRNYLLNVLFGKEFEDLGKKRNQTFAVNTKIYFGGGRKIIPLLRDNQGNLAVDPENNHYWDYAKAYENSIDDVFQLNMSFTYKWNRPKATHELFIDLINVTDNLQRMVEYYDESKPGSIGYVTQFMFFPNFIYRVYF